jgi:hypothetical protein
VAKNLDEAIAIVARGTQGHVEIRPVIDVGVASDESPAPLWKQLTVLN